MAKRKFSARRPRSAVEARLWSSRKLAAIEHEARQRCEEMMGFFDEGAISTTLEDLLVNIANSSAAVIELLDELVAESPSTEEEQ